MCGKKALLIASLAVVMMLGTSPAWSQSDCEKRCILNYNHTRYPSDQRICMESPSPGRCIKETMDNAKEYCRIGCAAGFKGENNSSRANRLPPDAIKVEPLSPKPPKGTPSSVIGHRD
jgi:hypothetical protein